jgi:hypothetical protein
MSVDVTLQVRLARQEFRVPLPQDMTPCITAGVEVSKYLAASVFRGFIIYFLATRIFRVKNYALKMQVANSSETSVASNQYHEVTGKCIKVV